MTRKWKHSLVGLALVSATVAAPAAVSTAGAQTGWGGFEVEVAPSEVNVGSQSPAFGAATTEDLGGSGADIWDNNHALLSEALVDYTGPGFQSSQLAPQDGVGVDSHGSYFGDLDGDGDDDLIETAGCESINRVFINNGGTLEFVPNTGIETLDARSRSVLLVDIDLDGDLDAVVANLDSTLLTDANGDPLPAAPSALYLNDGTGTSWTEAPDVNNAISDDNVRYVSLTSTGPGTDQVIITSNSFAFGLDTLRTGVSAPIAAVNPVRQSIGVDDNFSNARDIALGDLDGDLDIEFVVARQQDRLGLDDMGDQVGPSLAGQLAIGIGQVGSGGSSALEVVQDITSDTLADNCRAVSLADFDNDADLDIFGGCTFDEAGQTTNIVLLNDGAGNFTLNTSALPATGADTAAVVINLDINNDGWIDTFVGNGFDDDNAADDIYINQGGSNHWLQIDLETAGDDDAGAQVFVGTDKWQVRETGHRNHRGQDSSTLHFGLADQDEIAPVEIQWPDGTFETCTISGVDQRVTITQGGPNCVGQTQTGLVAAVNAQPVLPVPTTTTTTTTTTAPAAGPTCATLAVTVNIADGEVPTAGDDVIVGTPGNDVINGLGGNDTICGLGGNDTINGGAGADRIVGAAGDDTLNGGDGFDQIFGGPGDDVVRGGAGNDRLNGGDGVDRIFGENGNDRIFGGGGNDILNGDGGLDRVAGGNGNDLLNGGTHDDELLGNLGLDRLNGDGGNDVLRGGFARDTFNGGAGNNDGCTLSDPNGVIEVRISCEGGVFGR